VHGREDLDTRRAKYRTRAGFDYVHAAIDDHTRIAYAEIHPDEKVDTCAGSLRQSTWTLGHRSRQLVFRPSLAVRTPSLQRGAY
jgi:hypothetical protein